MDSLNASPPRIDMPTALSPDRSGLPNLFLKELLPSINSFIFNLKYLLDATPDHINVYEAY